MVKTFKALWAVPARVLVLCVGILASGLLGVCPQVSAQEAASQGATSQGATSDEQVHQRTSPRDIVVRGSAFAAPLQEVPQSATAVQSQQLQERGQQNIQDVIESVPNLTWAGGTSRPRFFLVRGIGEFEQYEGAPNPSVATIVDGVDFSGLGLVVPFFDIDQMEVLRGPQAIRYGASGLAGAVALRSVDPSPVTSGRVELSAGNDEFGSGGASIGGAIPGTNEQLQLRFSAFKLQSDGFRDNPFLSRDDTNERDESMARLKVRYQPSAALTVDWSGWVVDNNNGYDVFTIDNTFTTESDRPGRDELFVRATSLTVTARVADNLKLESISSGFSAEQDYSFDGDWGNNEFWGSFAPYDYFSDTDRTRRTLAQEVRLSSDDPQYVHGDGYRWVVGGFAQRLAEDTATGEFSNNEQYDYLASDYEASTGAVFGQLETPLGYATSITSALRYEHRSAKYDDSRMAFFSPDFDMFGGDITLAHDLSRQVRVYASASRGFKGGGINAGPSVPTDRRAFDDEYMWSFETGVKGVFFNRRLSSNLAVFRQLRRDQQLKFAFQDNPSDPLSFTYITESSGRGESTGVELENTFSATERLKVFASGALLATEFTSVPEESASLEGRDFSHAPSWQYLVGARYALSDSLFTRVEVTGKDAFYFDDSNNERSNAYYLLNASAGYQYDNWSLTAWGRNLTDQEYDVRGFFFGNEPPDFPNKRYVQLGDPRAFGVTFAYNF